MQRFMIGLYGGFDEKKYRRDFRKSFYGIEACLFETEEDVAKLACESKQRGFRIGIHFPFRRNDSRLRDALFLSQDDEVRKEAYEAIERELTGIFELQPEYILFHYPKPVILDDRVSWDNWRFADRREHVRESEYSLDEFAMRSEQLFEWLSAKASQHDFTPVLEFDALNRYVYEGSFLPLLLERYPRIKLCLDTARLHAQEMIDPYFDAGNVLRTYAKYAKTVHLSNIKIAGSAEYHHYPALPDCRPEDGWAPIEDYLEIIRRENPEVTILFEHRSDWITDEQLETCYRWIERIMSGHSK